MTDTGCLKYGRPSTFVPYRQSSLGRAADLRGQQFGEFTVITQAKSEVLINKKGRKTCRAAWLCRCACGAQQVVTATRLRVGYAVRCAHCVRNQDVSMMTTKSCFGEPKRRQVVVVFGLSFLLRSLSYLSKPIVTIAVRLRSCFSG